MTLKNVKYHSMRTKVTGSHSVKSTSVTGAHHTVELCDMSQTAQQKVSARVMNQPIFQPYPSEVVFKNYKPFKTYKVPLVLRNIDKIPRNLKVSKEDSLYFQVVSPRDGSRKVAPGMTSTFTVLFTPQENKDYDYRVIFVTERKSIKVPIRAIGARAILEFPDQLTFPLCPIKCLSQKTFLVRNVGNREAKFKLCTKSPFSVKPSAGTLKVEESMQVTINYFPRTSGNHSQQLLLHYHTGENVYIKLCGASTDISVRLDKNKVVMEKTYVTMSNQQTVTILNKSDSIVHYQWKNCATKKQEEQQRTSWFLSKGERQADRRGPDGCSGLFQNAQIASPPRFYSKSQQEGNNMKEFLAACNVDPTGCHHVLWLGDVLQNRRRLTEPHQDCLSFSGQNFVIEPQEGNIFPQRTAKINITFKPHEPGLYQHTVYCDITGHEARLPLRIKGKGLGPKLVLDCEVLDMGNIFLGTTQIYEVVVSNEGLIYAPYKLVPPSTAMSQCFSFSPAEDMLPPGKRQAMEVHFTANILGTFSEKFYFTVMGSPESLSLTLSGCIIGPTFHFSIPELHFGEVSFGFTHTITCCIHNTSLIPMNFDLRIPGDGTGRDSVSSTEQIAQLDRNEWKPWDRETKRPREFRVTPNSGTIQALGKINIEVTLCSNTVQEYSLVLVMDVQGVGENLLTLPIKARCVVPELRLEMQTLRYDLCFLGYPYEQSFRLINDSSLPACYGFLPQAHEEDPSLLFNASHPRGVIQPNSTEDIPVIIKAKKLGHLLSAAYIAILGQKEPQLALLLTCFGQGPAVSLSASEMHFGTVPVITDVPRTLKLYNHSPIPARFLAQMVQTRSYFRVEPEEGEVPPMDQFELRVVANLDAVLPFRDHLQLTILNGESHTIFVSAMGYGTTITTDRPFAPVLDLGTHFSSHPCRYHFRLINRGRHVHILRWFPKSSQRSLTKPTHAFKQRKYKTPLAASPLDAPVFTLRPTWLKLGPGQFVEMLLETSCNRPEVVKERLVCQALIGQQRIKRIIMTVEVTCRFIAPVLEISTRQLNFFVEKVPGMSLEPLYERLHLKNVCTLAFTVELSLADPFGLCNHDDDDSFTTSKTMVLDAGAEAELWVRFDPLYQLMPGTRVFEEVLEVRYSEHPQQDSVTLQGEVHFPNLHFSSKVVDFGCILSHTKAQQQLTMSNCSPLPITYHWSFKTNQHWHCISQCGVPHETNDLKNETKEGMWSQEELPSTFHKDRESLTQIPSMIDPKFLKEAEIPTLEAEEVFEISPTFGVLQPDESQLVTVLFFSHTDVSSEVLALCEVEEGPVYEITLKGESSEITYTLDTTDIDFGPQLFNHVMKAEITLRNTGKVGFDFSAVLEDQQHSSEDPLPGQAFLIPRMGYIEAYAEMKLSVCYLPGVPEVFQKTLHLQVAFSEAKKITLRGEGIFPSVCLNLPRNLDEKKYSSVLNQARAAVEGKRQLSEVESRLATEEPSADYDPICDALLQLEIERLLVKEHVVGIQKSPRDPELTETQSSTCQWWRKLNTFVLPEYILDFGCVIYGTVSTRIVKMTNTGPVSVTFRAEWHSLAGTGFSTELNRVKNLAYCETETFKIKFDPHGANLKLGETSTVMHIQILGGPTVQVRLCAVVTMPYLTISTSTLQFDSIQCGFCQVATVQLHNPSLVPSKWRAIEEEQSKSKTEKYILPDWRQKDCFKEQPSLTIFEILPSSGVVFPGEWVNVSVKFCPAEEKMYQKKLVLTISQSIYQVLLLVRGQGKLPHLGFSTSEWILKPLMPCSGGQEFEVVVQNPCSFPIEFYSLEFDKQYLEEEKILRMMKGYDAQNVLLLPPRTPGKPLPPELLEYYKEHGSQDPDSRTSCMGDQEMNSVIRSVSCSMGIDLSPESKAASNRKGIAIIVHGAPLTGKTDLAVNLARYYGAAYLSIDGVVQEAMSSGSTPAALQARKLWGTDTREAILWTAEKTGGGKDHVKGHVTTPRLPHHIPDVQFDIYMTFHMTFDPTCQNKNDTTATPVPAMVTGAGQSLGILGVEAVARHTAEVGQDSKPKAPASTVSTRHKTSATVAKRNSPSTIQAGQAQMLQNEGVNPMEVLGTASSLVFEDLLVEILSKRLQLSDCYHGVIVDGLETQYCGSLSAVLQIVLKAFNNRNYIYVINLVDSYDAFKDRERAKIEAEEALQREKMEREKRRLKKLEEDKDQETLEMEQEMWQQEELESQEEDEEENDEKKASTEDTTEDHMEQDGKDSFLECAREIDEEGQKKDQESKDDKPDDPRDSPLKEGEPEPGLCTESDEQLLARFHLYEQSLSQVQYILQHWDRTQGHLSLLISGEEQPQEPEESTEKQVPSTKKTKKGPKKEKTEQERKEKDRVDRKEKDKPKRTNDVKPQLQVAGQAGVLAEGTVEPEKDPQSEPISSICFTIEDEERVNADMLLSSLQLPPLQMVLDELGLGVPSIPLPKLFSVVHYPRKRSAPCLKPCLGFAFLEPTSSKDMVQQKEKEVTVEKGKTSTVTKGSQKHQRQAKKGGKNISSISTDTKSSGHSRADEDVVEGSRKKLTHFRWIVPANGQVTLKILFEPTEPQVFAEQLTFELLGSKRCYELTFKGVCAYPSISTNYEMVFAHCKRVLKPVNGLLKAYIISSGLYDFGPQLCGKTTIRCSGLFPESTVRLVMHNNSPMDTEIKLSFKHGTKSSTFLLESDNMFLKPNEKKELSITACPMASGILTDSVVCNIKDNPDPVIFHLSCLGVQPQLELESICISFGRVLLQSIVERRLSMKNPTVLPLAWRLTGLEGQGNEISIPQQMGIIKANSTFYLPMCFNAKKPFIINKKINLMVSDEKYILGDVQTILIDITGEAYDVALDIIFPKGVDGLNFGTVKVAEEATLTINLITKSKYEIGFRFVLEPTMPGMPDLNSVFTIVPLKGSLFPRAKETSVQFTFHHNKELAIEHQPILRCQVTDPNIESEGEIVFTIPIKVSVQCRDQPIGKGRLFQT